MAEEKRSERVLPDQPEYRPLERFWPYAELTEEPSDEELAKVHPELAGALFGERVLPFSISVEFPAFEGARYGRAVDLARTADEYVETTVEGIRKHRARYFPADRPERLRDLWELVCDVDGTDVLVDDRAVPYARELWLPLVWWLIR
jgi:hypothetical protein